MWISRGMTKLLFLLKLLFRKTPVQVRWNIETMFLCCWISHDMSFRVAFFILEMVSQFLSDNELNTWNRAVHRVCESVGHPDLMTLVKWQHFWNTLVYLQHLYEEQMMGHPLAIRGVRRLSWLFFFIKFNVEMIYLNGECRAIYPRLSHGHDFAGLFST